MAEVGAIGKDQKNEAQHYSFRGIDTVYNELHGLLAKHRVFTTPEVIAIERHERESKSGGVLLYSILTIRYTFHADDGSTVACVVVGEGMDSGDKASNKAMAVAHKYALLQVFAVPTAEKKDPEDDSPTPTARGNATGSKISDAQVRLLNVEVSKRGIDRDAFHTYCDVKSFKDIDRANFEKFLTAARRRPEVQQEEPPPPDDDPNVMTGDLPF
jgi:hypothetical protein